jgi:hypothetical protein
LTFFATPATTFYVCKKYPFWQLYIGALMVFTDSSLKELSMIQHRVRTAIAQSASPIPYTYEGEFFFTAYEALRSIWKKRASQRTTSEQFSLGRSTIRDFEKAFVDFGAMGLLSIPSSVPVNPQLERLVVMVKTARPHTSSRSILSLARALRLEPQAQQPSLTLELIHRIQRSWGYGQRFDKQDVAFFREWQKIIASLSYHRKRSGVPQLENSITSPHSETLQAEEQALKVGAPLPAPSRKSMNDVPHDAKKKVKLFSACHDTHRREDTFFALDEDPFQYRVELFRELSQLTQRRQIRAMLTKYGMASNRFYALKTRYHCYGIWGLVDVTHTSRRSHQTMCSKLELSIIEARLMDPALSTREIIKELELKCTRGNVQKIYQRWNLSSFTEAVPLKGVLAETSLTEENMTSAAHQPLQSARLQFPELVKTANLKIHASFRDVLRLLSYHHLPLSNPGALIAAPFLEQLGVVEAIYTYGPETYRTTEITNDIIVNVLRIIAGFPTINTYLQNTDRSVAIGAGLFKAPQRSQFYRSLDEFTFHHLQKLRNDACVRAKELSLIEAKEIAIDYHCDPSDSRYPHDKALSKAPDKNGDMVYAHRPQIIWDSITNSIINIAYCEGRSRGPSALYHFIEDNLFQVIDRQAVAEIYADSEYTGEKQLVYLHVHSKCEVTLCLKQNPKIKKWREETIKNAVWEAYGDKYRVACKDFVLAQSGKPFRFIVKHKIETGETRCFGSTHVDWSVKQILDKYHIRWPVETGIKDLVENYFLNKPTGDSPEKVEVHYYCVMLARLLVDYFKQIVCEPTWAAPQETWESVLSTIRTTVFSNQNCELSVTDDGDMLITYLDGDPQGIKSRLQAILKDRKKHGLNKVSWWEGRGVQIEIVDKFNLNSGTGVQG